MNSITRTLVVWILDLVNPKTGKIRYKTQSEVVEFDEQELLEMNRPMSAFEEIPNVITYDQVRDLNGKHVIYGLVEGWEQSGLVPETYNRKTAKYQFLIS